jgi:phosphoglycolate phosphatase-like HAD superfamily hydrolase
MIEKASTEHNLDLHKSWIVGDRMSDVAAGQKAGAKGILLQNHDTIPMEKELGERFKTLVFDAVLKASWVPGALEFLEKNYRTMDCFVGSGTPHEELQQIVERRGLKKYFKGVYGSPPAKKEIIETILNLHGYCSQEVVYVGDAESDRLASEAAQVAFIARDTGGRVDFGKHPKISNLFELEAQLKLSEVNHGN